MKSLKLFLLFSPLIIANLSWSMNEGKAAMEIDDDIKANMVWQPMNNDGVEMAQLMLVAADKIAAVDGHENLHILSLEKARARGNRDIYRLKGMIILEGDMVLGNFTIYITKTTINHPRWVERSYDVEYVGDDPFPPPPPLVRCNAIYFDRAR